MARFTIPIVLACWIASVALPLGIKRPARAVLPQSWSLAKRQKVQKSDTVKVTAAEVVTEQIGTRDYAQLRLTVENTGPDPVQSLRIYYEIYDESGTQIREAGSVAVQPWLVPPDQPIPVETDLNQSGWVKITLLQWQTLDLSPAKHLQMQVFQPRIGTEDAP
ncbi:hypothetical protein [Lyngbya confervoides]|uniref:ApaG domain-containing protein n=1 Tax=Lyngbya confervoides BDU141951 TaxID=1574623 RepID=A0ABD4T5Z6_9CYAN|nr:hypothetical protein [Lyngbya confervoides]MCM1984114.1 ApaG domain-containing protein [Lyngbya confervoides BDU141951]